MNLIPEYPAIHLVRNLNCPFSRVTFKRVQISDVRYSDYHCTFQGHVKFTIPLQSNKLHLSPDSKVKVDVIDDPIEDLGPVNFWISSLDPIEALYQGLDTHQDLTPLVPGAQCLGYEDIFVLPNAHEYTEFQNKTTFPLMEEYSHKQLSDWHLSEGIIYKLDQLYPKDELQVHTVGI